MVKNLKLKSLVLASVCMILLVFGAAAEDIGATLKVDYDGDGAIDKAVDHTIAEGSTALDLLNESSDMTTEEKEWGISVVGIDGWMTNWEGEGTWWMFEVNGEQSDVSVDGYVLEDGDIVTMSLAGAEEGAITVVLELDYEGDEMVDKAIHTVMMEGATALDLLNETTDVTTEEKEWGILVVGIDDVATNYEEDGTWWILEINGVMSELSVDSYVLETGDTIAMSLGGDEEAEEHKAATV